MEWSPACQSSECCDTPQPTDFSSTPSTRPTLQETQVQSESTPSWSSAVATRNKENGMLQPYCASGSFGEQSLCPCALTSMFFATFLWLSG